MREFRKLMRLYNGFILPLILFMVSAGIVFWGIIPGVKTIQNMYIKNAELAKEVSKIKSRVDTLESLDLPTLQSYLDSLLSAVPHEKSLPTFLLSLEGLAQQTGVAVNGFSVDKPGSLASGSAETISKTVDQYAVIADVTVAGTLEQLNSFFATLIKVRRLMAVTDFSLSFSKDSPVMVSGMSLRAFYAPLPKTLGKADSPLEPLSDRDTEILARVSAYPSAIITQILPFQPGTVREDPFSL